MATQNVNEALGAARDALSMAADLSGALCGVFRDLNPYIPAEGSHLAIAMQACLEKLYSDLEEALEEAIAEAPREAGRV